MRAAAAELPEESRARVRLGVELVWERFHGPLFVAAMELWTAARTDPQCRAILSKQRGRGKPYRVAVSHVARKLVHIVYAVLAHERQHLRRHDPLRYLVLYALSTMAFMVPVVPALRRRQEARIEIAADRAALEIDTRFGLSERLSTALGLTEPERDTPAGRAVLADAADALSGFLGLRRRLELVGEALPAAGAEDRERLPGVGRLEVAHVLDDAEHRDVDAPEHLRAAQRVAGGDLLRDQPEVKAQPAQPLVGVVLAHQKSVFDPARHHAVGLVAALEHEVVEENT